MPNVVAVHLPDFHVYVATIYITPSNTIVDDNGLIDFLLDFCLGKEALLMGNFNLLTIKCGGERFDM